LPVVGEPIANVARPEARQQVEDAQLDILDAALTLGTGAAYTREQLMGYRRSYFPQPGDKPKNIIDKKARLDTILRAARIAAGRAQGGVSYTPKGTNFPKARGAGIDPNVELPE
jgi:hypothetical protein